MTEEAIISVTKIRLRVKTVSRTKFYLTKKNSLNVLFS